MSSWAVHQNGIKLTDIFCKCSLESIGMGTGGLVAAAGNTGIGAKVALIKE